VGKENEMMPRKNFIFGGRRRKSFENKRKKK
jgi:hypothetical protein